jgi:hypothetical protein
MGKFIYKVYKSPSSTILEYEVDSWQKAIDIWSNLKQSGNSPYISCIGEERSMIVNSQSGIREWSDYLLINNYNRVERRIMLDMQDQEMSGMKVVEVEETGNFGYSAYLEREAEAEYQALVKESNYTVSEECEKKKAIDFHGNFSKMDQSSQDEIINPKHYKMIPKEAYDRFPEGLEYMDLMEYILDSHSGVNSHLLGQIFKYSCRLGKKDADLQDARKIEWYASRLVKSLEHQLIGGEF